MRWNRVHRSGRNSSESKTMVDNTQESDVELKTKDVDADEKLNTVNEIDVSSSLQSPLETYLREINETKLLTADEEKQLAGAIALGDVRAAAGDGARAAWQGAAQERWKRL